MIPLGVDDSDIPYYLDHLIKEISYEFTSYGFFFYNKHEAGYIQSSLTVRPNDDLHYSSQ